MQVKLRKSGFFADFFLDLMKVLRAVQQCGLDWRPGATSDPVMGRQRSRTAATLTRDGERVGAVVVVCSGTPGRALIIPILGIPSGLAVVKEIICMNLIGVALSVWV